jgi:hypothetical protein
MDPMPSPRSLCRLPGWLPLLFALSLPLSLDAAGANPRTAPALDPSYVPALAVANHFLQAWQAGDVESGTVLLSTHAKQTLSREDLDRFFSNSDPSGYEIDRGTPIKHGRYEFPVVLVTSASKNPHVRRRFSTIVIVNTGKNDWAVDKLP